jgi:hypothetical protein
MPLKDEQKRKEYLRTYGKEYYQKNKEKLLRNQHQKNTRRVAKRRAWVRQYKAQKGCSRCSEKEPCCLQFHHRNPSEKLFDIGCTDALQMSMERLLKEIAKCDILCANCHAKHHAGIIQSAE